MTISTLVAHMASNDDLPPEVLERMREKSDRITKRREKSLKESREYYRRIRDAE